MHQSIAHAERSLEITPAIALYIEFELNAARSGVGTKRETNIPIQ